MSNAFQRRSRSRPRRGVTLVEMLVVVALVVLMMVILVQIFQSALGAMSASRTTQELDVVLRQIDSMIRSDLGGSTAKMTPPNDPALKSGYFEYGENSFADAQGEDTDDYIAFTTKAPEGQVFTGRQYLSPPANQNIQPTTITSQLAEVIYFVRNGNLYRRVFLVAPDRSKSLTQLTTFRPFISGSIFGPSWQGMNDISCRPVGNPNVSPTLPIPNDLGDLTNRENRAFRPRFLNDFNGNANGNGPDGIPDDNNADGIPDYYPTVYTDGSNSHNGRPNYQIRDLHYPNNTNAWLNPGSYDVYAFPFIYPGMFSVPDNSNPAQRVTNGLGWIHYQPLNNHAPLDVGDNLPVPAVPPVANQVQTWWGFPTWRETMTGLRGTVLGWTDPVAWVSAPNFTQPMGLRPFPPSILPATNSTNFLPPIYQPGTNMVPYSFDGAGSSSFVADPDLTGLGALASVPPNRLWEDDLILTHVRSFDVKAYDNDASLYNTTVNGYYSSGYLDLGYGANTYVAGLTGNNNGVQNAVPFQTVNSNGLSNEPVGFGHEGRMPPLFTDFRYHPRYQGSNGTTPYLNIGDSSPGVLRLTRVWDSWSTSYTSAPDSDVLLDGYVPGFKANSPIYPSFPAPYPSPLRGIQIQIRVTDPRNERTKVLTIRHDFTDKLSN